VAGKSGLEIEFYPPHYSGRESQDLDNIISKIRRGRLGKHPQGTRNIVETFQTIAENYTLSHEAPLKPSSFLTISMVICVSPGY